LPECEFSAEQFVSDVKAELEKHNSVIVAVSEGVELDIDLGERATSATDGFGHTALSGVGKQLENLVKDKIGCKVRSIELNVMQRCSSHLSSKRDITEAERIAGAAVKVALDGHSGKMMIFKRVANRPYNVKIEFVDVEKVANRVKYFPNEWINEAGNGVTKEAIEYCLPLIQGEQNFHMQNGIPKQYVLKCALPRDVGSHEP
jgi:6-phosphofructokinase 1